MLPSDCSQQRQHYRCATFLTPIARSFITKTLRGTRSVSRSDPTWGLRHRVARCRKRKASIVFFSLLEAVDEFVEQRENFSDGRFVHTVSTENFEHAVGNTHRLFA